MTWVIPYYIVLEIIYIYIWIWWRTLWSWCGMGMSNIHKQKWFGSLQVCPCQQISSCSRWKDKKDFAFSICIYQYKFSPKVVNCNNYDYLIMMLHKYQFPNTPKKKMRLSYSYDVNWLCIYITTNLTSYNPETRLYRVYECIRMSSANSVIRIFLQLEIGINNQW